jgi:hypothetical protein
MVIKQGHGSQDWCRISGIAAANIPRKWIVLIKEKLKDRRVVHCLS